MLRVHVTDTGKGLTQQEMAKLSVLFGKVDDHMEDVNNDGIGIGITLCQKIVEISGGQIDFTSKGENKGSTFMFTMKMNLPSEDNDSNKNEPESQLLQII